jgi:hypothetical protein
MEMSEAPVIRGRGAEIDWDALPGKTIRLCLMTGDRADQPVSFAIRASEISKLA